MQHAWLQRPGAAACVGPRLRHAGLLIPPACRPIACSIAASSQAAPAHADTPVQTARSGPTLGELGFSTAFNDEFAISLKALGAGRYGVVYKAHHKASGRAVAVKVMTKERDDRTREEHLASIHLEVALWKACQSCAHVVRLEGVYEDERCVYMVQQLCTGGDLRSVLQAGLLTEREAAQVLRTVLNVIDHCHALNHLYGDCKPHNFLLLHPHSIAGCQQFPPAPAADVKQAALVNSSTQTIHEHVSVKLSASASSSSGDSSMCATRAVNVPSNTSPSNTAPANSILPAPASLRAAMSAQITPLPTLPTSSGSQDTQEPGWISLMLNAQPATPPRPQPPSSPASNPAAMLTSSEVWCGMQCHEQLVVLATDFGCCQPLHGPRRGAARGKRIGSPVYMAPEMWQANGHVGVGVDVWAAGVMLYQLLSGRYPFWSLSPDEIDQGGMELYQLVCGISSNPILLTGAPWDKVSKGCKDLIQAMLERQPHVRISARQALRHPWMVQQLGCTPLPSTSSSNSRKGDKQGKGSDHHWHDEESWEASMKN